MDQALPGRHTLRLYGSLTSDQTAVLVQARTGHYRLNQYLSRRGLVNSTTCKCSQGEDTIQHVTLVCQQWVKEREELRVVAGRRVGDIPFLLGGWRIKKDSKGQFVDGLKEKWIPDLKVVKATIRFFEQTERLDFRQQAVEA
jgi:hypothetical protein